MINLNSSHQLSTILFGGTVQIEERVPELNELGVHQQIKSGKNKGVYKYKIKKTEKYVYGFGLEPDQKWQTKAKNKVIYQTNEKVLKILLESNPDNEELREFIELILQIKEKEKLIGTYYEGFRDMLHTDSCVHPNFQHTSTDTGRTSCNKPNLQNISNER
jgi:DNA polymerase I-like protein with 3'-5' exonuclease and polymerase domains